MADILSFDYYDSEIIYAVSKSCGMEPNFVERSLNSHGWQDFPITFRGTLRSGSYVQFSKVSLLLQ